MNVMQKTIIASLIALGVSTSASAVTLNVNSLGTLTGAQDVLIGSDLYDVTFRDGLVTNGISAFTDSSSAQAASLALSKQVFNSGIYNTNPEKTNGCTDKTSCFIYTFWSSSNGWVSESHLTNNAGSTDTIGSGSVFNLVNTVDLQNATLAIWTKKATGTTATAVPEPEQYAMMLAGLGLVGFAARRKLAK